MASDGAESAGRSQTQLLMTLMLIKAVTGGSATEGLVNKGRGAVSISSTQACVPEV